MYQFITRTGNLTRSMPRLYVSCHPDEFDLHFRTICADIFAEQENCVIFYEENQTMAAEEELYALLGEMRLIAVPVTRKLLTESSRAMETEIPFARKNSIPILPIMVEEDASGELIKAYNSTEIFHGIQFLNRLSKDPTDLRYKDKLAAFLRSVLVSEDEARRIQDEFSSRIFLSYRKKDRKHAKELMRRIHKVDICRDTAIWYDEYLIPGESFNDNIMSALNESNVFVMSVSSSFMEPDNYVAIHEYPDAVRKNKPRIAVDMKRFDQDSLDQLETMYPGINVLMVDPDDPDMLDAALRQRLIEDAGISEGKLLNNDGEHLYYIALAYKNGIHIEADPSKAADIFRLSADNGFYESYLKLIKMYRMGDGVPKEPNAALMYCEKAENALRPIEGSSLRADNALASVYDEKGHILQAELTGKIKEAIVAYRAAFALRRKMQMMYKDASLLDYCESMFAFASILYSAGLYDKARDLAVTFIAENGVLMEGGEETGEDTAQDLTLLRIRMRICSFLCPLYDQLRQHTEVMKYAKLRMEACERIEDATGSVEDLRSLADAYLAYAGFLPMTDIHEANKYVRKCMDIRSRLDEFDRNRPKTISDAIDTFGIAENALMRIYSGDIFAVERAKLLFNEVLEICKEHRGNRLDEYKAALLTSDTFESFGTIEKINGSVQKAMTHFEKALAVCRDAEKHFGNEISLMYRESGLLVQIGILYFEMDDLTNATQCYTDALEIDMRLARRIQDPTSQHHLAESYMRCAEINTERGHQPVADVNNRSALRILEKLAQETEDYRIMEDLARVNIRLGQSKRFAAEQRLNYFQKASLLYDGLLKMTNNAAKYISAYAEAQEHIRDLS